MNERVIMDAPIRMPDEQMLAVQEHGRIIRTPTVDELLAGAGRDELIFVVFVAESPGADGMIGVQKNAGHIEKWLRAGGVQVWYVVKKATAYAVYLPAN